MPVPVTCARPPRLLKCARIQRGDASEVGDPSEYHIIGTGMQMVPAAPPLFRYLEPRQCGGTVGSTDAVAARLDMRTAPQATLPSACGQPASCVFWVTRRSSERRQERSIVARNGRGVRGRGAMRPVLRIPRSAPKLSRGSRVSLFARVLGSEGSSPCHSRACTKCIELHAAVARASFAPSSFCSAGLCWECSSTRRGRHTWHSLNRSATWRCAAERV